RCLALPFPSEEERADLRNVRVLSQVKEVVGEPSPGGGPFQAVVRGEHLPVPNDHELLTIVKETVDPGTSLARATIRPMEMLTAHLLPINSVGGAQNLAFLSPAGGNHEHS